MQVVMDRGDESEIVSADIEYHNGPAACHTNFVSRTKRPPDIMKLLPSGALGYVEPMLQSGCRIGMPGSELANRRRLDDPHYYIL
jgi:hypothetical protein